MSSLSCCFLLWKYNSSFHTLVLHSWYVHPINHSTCKDQGFTTVPETHISRLGVFFGVLKKSACLISASPFVSARFQQLQCPCSTNDIWSILFWDSLDKTLIPVRKNQWETSQTTYVAGGYRNKCENTKNLVVSTYLIYNNCFVECASSDPVDTVNINTKD